MRKNPSCITVLATVATCASMYSDHISYQGHIGKYSFSNSAEIPPKTTIEIVLLELSGLSHSNVTCQVPPNPHFPSCRGKTGLPD